MKHNFDYFTRHCVQCGAGKAAIANGQRGVDCPGGEGSSVVGISHRIIERKHAKLRTMPTHQRGHTP